MARDTTMQGQGFVLQIDQDPIPVTYTIRQRQKFVQTNEAGKLRGGIDLISAELVPKSGMLPTDTVAQIEFQDGTKKNIVINRLVRSKPATYDFAILTD